MPKTVAGKQSRFARLRFLGSRVSSGSLLLHVACLDSALKLRLVTGALQLVTSPESFCQNA